MRGGSRDIRKEAKIGERDEADGRRVRVSKGDETVGGAKKMRVGEDGGSAKASRVPKTKSAIGRKPKKSGGVRSEGEGDDGGFSGHFELDKRQKKRLG